MLSWSHCSICASGRSPFGAKLGQVRARGSTRTGAVARVGAQREDARREARTGRVALGARAHGGVEAHAGATREEARREGVRHARRTVRGRQAGARERLRRSDGTRDPVQGRLLALNAERASEERGALSRDAVQKTRKRDIS